MYLITNEGLKVLEKSGLKKILDSSMDYLYDKVPISYMYDDSIEEYADEHGISDLLEKIESDDTWNRNDSFIMHSEVVLDLLKNKLPKNLERDVKDAISAYYIYHDKFLRRIGYNKQFFWRDEKFLNVIESNVHGDMYIGQYDIGLGSELDLFDYKPLVKKTGSINLNGFYPHWITTLIDFMTFCCQIDKPVPFKDDWEKVFYNGKFGEVKTGMVAEDYIKNLKYAKEGNEFGHLEVLPFMDNPKKHINIEKKIFHTGPVVSDGGYTSYPFIDNNTLVYLSKVEKGIEFLGESWGNPSIKFNYNQIGNAIKGLVTCILKGGSRSSPQDPGLVFKYFPHERFKELF